MRFPFQSDRLLALASHHQSDELVQIESANYRSNLQLSLDENLPGEERSQYAEASNCAAWRLACRLLHLDKTVRFTPPPEW